MINFTQSLFDSVSPTSLGGNSRNRAPKKKRKRFPIIPSYVIENRIILSYFLFLSEPVDFSLNHDLPFIQPGKDLIFLAHVNALTSGKGFKKSSSMVRKTKRLREKDCRLRNYFIDSEMVVRPDGRKFRNVNRITSRNVSQVKKVLKKKCTRKLRTTNNRNRYLLRRKFKQVHIGLYCAPGNFLPRQENCPMPRKLLQLKLVAPGKTTLLGI